MTNKVLAFPRPKTCNLVNTPRTTDWGWVWRGVLAASLNPTRRRSGSMAAMYKKSGKKCATLFTSDCFVFRRASPEYVSCAPCMYYACFPPGGTTVSKTSYMSPPGTSHLVISRPTRHPRMYVRSCKNSMVPSFFEPWRPRDANQAARVARKTHGIAKQAVRTDVSSKFPTAAHEKYRYMMTSCDRAYLPGRL